MKSLTLLFVLCAPTWTVAADEELEKILNDRYGGKALHLRHFIKSDSQEYDPQGIPLRRRDEGAWTLYGGMLVKKFTVRDDILLVEGNRAPYVYDNGEKRLKPIAGREKLTNQDSFEYLAHEGGGGGRCPRTRLCSDSR